MTDVMAPPALKRTARALISAERIAKRVQELGEQISGVYADIESAGAYKSFGESYTRRYPTPANREAVAAVVGDLHEQLKDLPDGAWVKLVPGKRPRRGRKS